MDHPATRSTRRKEALRTFVALLAAVCIWTPNMHHLFLRPASCYRPAHGNSELALELAAAQTQIWSNPKVRVPELRRLRACNPEWDFMSRTYLVLSLANMALRDHSYLRSACRNMDVVLDDTLHLEREKGFGYFLLPYGQGGGWTIKPPRSIFVDGRFR